MNHIIKEHLKEKMKREKELKAMDNLIKKVFSSKNCDLKEKYHLYRTEKINKNQLIEYIRESQKTQRERIAIDFNGGFIDAY